MAWNQPGNNGQDRDPWGNDIGNDNNNSGNNKDRRNNPSGMDSVFHKINQLLGEISKGGGGNKGHHSRGSVQTGKLITTCVVIALIIWGISGFYTIREGEVGVITRFGKLQKDDLVNSGLHWRPLFIDDVTPVDVSSRRTIETSGTMLTKDENVVQLWLTVEYDVADPAQYLFSVTDANNSLKQATDSALRAIVGKYPMDTILTEGRQLIRNDTQNELIKITNPYKMGLRVIQVNLKDAKPPEAVKDAFDDAISAREDEQRYIVESRTYANKVLPEAAGNASRIVADAKAYRDKLVLEAQGEVTRFEKLLPEYLLAPEVTRQRLYMETMEKVLSKNSKILLEGGNNNLMVLPLEQLLNYKKNETSKADIAVTVSQPSDSMVPLSNMAQNMPNRVQTPTQARSVGNMIDSAANARTNNIRRGR